MMATWVLLVQLGLPEIADQLDQQDRSAHKEQSE